MNKKMKRIITVLALAISLCSVANAQMDVAGISVYSHPTRSQVESKLGKPLSYMVDNVSLKHFCTINSRARFSLPWLADHDALA